MGDVTKYDTVDYSFIGIPVAKYNKEATLKIKRDNMEM